MGSRGGSKFKLALDLLKRGGVIVFCAICFYEIENLLLLFRYHDVIIEDN